MASVNLAAAKIANVMLGWPMWQTLLICAVLNIAFAATVRPLGRARHRLHPVRHRDDGLVRGGLLRAPAARSRRAPRPHDPARSRRAPAPPRLRRLEADPLGARHPAHRPVVVASGIPAPSRAAAATSRSGCWRRAPSGTRWRARSSSTWRTTRCAPGPGSSWRSPRCWSIPQLSDIARQLPLRGPEADRPRHGLPRHAQVPARAAGWGSWWRGCSRRTSRPSRRTSTGAPRTWCTTSTGASCAPTRRSATM